MDEISEIRKLSGGRYLILCESGLRFPLYRKELSEYGLSEGVVLEEEMLSQIFGDVLSRRVKQRALHLLEKRDYTEHQLKEKLMQQSYPEELADEALAYVRSYRYVDDLRYAKTYLRGHLRDKGLVRLRNELLEKGIAREICEEALNETEFPDEEGQIRLLLEKKQYAFGMAEAKERQRMAAFLMRRGFSSSAIWTVLKESE